MALKDKAGEVPPTLPPNSRGRRTVLMIKTVTIIYHSLRGKSLKCIAYLISLKKLLDIFISTIYLFLLFFNQS